jgi:hypothetical protein
MLWYQYRQVPGRQDRCWSQSPEGHMCLRSPDMAKMDPNAADMALAVWNGYVRDASRHAGQWRPVEQVPHGSKDVGL